MGSRKLKPFAYFRNLSDFKNYKISCSAADDMYLDWDQIPGEAVPAYLPAGETVDIHYETICYIKSERLQYTHGTFFGEDTSPVWQQL